MLISMVSRDAATTTSSSADSLAIIYLFLVSVPLMFGSPPFNRAGLFSYQWSPATLSLSYLGLGTSLSYLGFVTP